LDETDFKLVSGREGLSNIVKKIIVAAMEPYDAVNYITKGCCIITPGDREDILMTALSCHLADTDFHNVISGIILSGGIMPHQKILELIRKANIPLLLAQGDTYKVASVIHDLTIKIRPQDKEKIEIVKKLIKDNVDIERLIRWM
jgi:BioD-like phosphotransacetylase family protein